jgi:hypothetical protein
MPTLGASLDFAKLEARNIRAHLLGTAPSSPVTGQLYYNTGDNTLYWYDGTAWISGRGTGPATTSSLGTIQLAGDLAGTATSPQIAAGVITDADVNSANKDGAQLTPSLRTLQFMSQAAMPGNATLAQIGVQNPAAASVSFNSQKITNLADPTANTDGANKQYVDNTAQGLDAKASVRCATTANIANLASLGSSVIDGVSLANGDRVLVKDQTTQSQNGIYIFATPGDLSLRAPDANTWVELPSAFVFVEQGTTNAESGWVCTSDQGGTLGTTAVTWTQFSGAGQINAGAGLTKTGNTIDAGAGVGISIAADTIAVDGTIIPRYYSSATHGAGTTWTITQATHGCRASRGLIVQCRLEADGSHVLPDTSVAANGDVTLTFGASQAANTIRTTIIG